MDQGSSVIRLAVFGKPVAQSLSPRIHGLFAQQCGIEIDYRAIEATAESLPRLAGELARQGGRGCNITVPLKKDAWHLATSCSENANRAEAANTLVLSSREWFAENTDGGGLVNDLRSSDGIKLSGSRICILGAGGAAAGVLAALLRAGPSIVVIANRTESRALELASRHADLGPVETCKPGDVESLAPFDLVINATSLGHAGSAPDLSPTWFTPDGTCYDMNYGEAAKPLRQLCGCKGITYRDGLGMLVGQAALSFELWTGQSPDAAAVLKQLRTG